MSGDERRAAILMSVLPLFARQGFASTTTRQLAETAGVSEALLYKHFPSKESLYEAIQRVGCQGRDAALDKIAGLEPSTATLVHIVSFLMRTVALNRPSGPISWSARHRLMLNSCLEDGAYPRFFFQRCLAPCFAKLEACLEAAAAAGDLETVPIGTRNRCLFAHHLAAMVAVMHLPETPVIDYQASPEELVDQATWFALRGMGLTGPAIAKYFHPKARPWEMEAEKSEAKSV